MTTTMTKTTTSDFYPYEWRYLPSGRVRHALNATDHASVAACGVWAWSYWDWCGTGSWREQVTLGGLPDCKKCVRMLGLG